MFDEVLANYRDANGFFKTVQGRPPRLEIAIPAKQYLIDSPLARELLVALGSVPGAWKAGLAAGPTLVSAYLSAQDEHRLSSVLLGLGLLDHTWKTESMSLRAFVGSPKAGLLQTLSTTNQPLIVSPGLEASAKLFGGLSVELEAMATVYRIRGESAWSWRKIPFVLGGGLQFGPSSTFGAELRGKYEQDDRARRSALESGVKVKWDHPDLGRGNVGLHGDYQHDSVEGHKVQILVTIKIEFGP